MERNGRALVAAAKGRELGFQDIIVDSPRSDEVLVEIYAVGICHADISCLAGKIPVEFPSVFGHEGGGVVKEVGLEVNEVQPGDAVLLSFNSCGTCHTCKRDAPAYCINMLPLNFGGTRLDKTHTIRYANGESLHGNFFGQSSFSNLAVVNKRCLVKVHPDTPFGLYAPLGCGLQTGAGAIFNTLNIRSGTSVVVFGTGSVGMAAIMAAKIRSAKTIIGVDIDASRLQTALELGATHCLLGNDTDLVNQIKTICDGDGAHYAVDCTGIAIMIEKMINCLGAMGKAATVGAPAPGTKVSVDVFTTLVKGRQYIGCNQGDSVPQSMIPLLIKHHREGTFPLEKIIRTYEVEDYRKALQDMKNREVIKPVLVWRA